MLIVRIFLFAVLLAAVTHAQEQWSVPLGAKPAQAPLVADVAPPAGAEVVVVLENGNLYGFQADGKPIWHAELGTPIAPGSQAAMAPGRDDAPALLVVPGAAATVALNAATGEPFWKTDLALGAGAGWAVLADVDDDKQPDAVLAGASGTLAALSGTDGTALWEYPGAATSNLSTISGAPSVADIDDDGVPEIFVAGKEGLLILDAAGKERNFAALDAAAACAAIIADCDDNGNYELYVVDANGTLLARDAANGDAIWDVKLDGEAGPPVQLATADLDQDEQGEIIAAGKKLYVVSGEGKVLFTRGGGGTGIAIGDANSDGEIEIVVASKNGLDLLDAALAHVINAPLPSPPVTGPVLAAINGAAVLTVGEDNVLRVRRTGGRLMPQLAPWPAPRRDASARAAAMSPLKELDLHAKGSQLAASNTPLAIAAGFEDAAQAAAWKPEAEGGAVARDEQLKANGTASLQVTPGATELRVVSPTVVAGPELRRVSASVLAKGENARAYLAWERAEGEPVLQELRPADTTPEGWRRFRLSNVSKPAGAKRVKMALVSAAGAQTNWDDVQTSGQSLSVPYVEIFYNQAGYEVHAPKRFTAVSTFPTPQGKFRILNEQGVQVHKDNTEPPARIVGAFNSDWGKFYWRGDFSAFNEPGKYRIEIDIDGNTAQSGPFEIAPDLMWTTLYTPLTGAITARRCTGEGECPHPYCAWDEGDNRGCDLNSMHLRALNEIYSMILWRIYDKDSGAVPPLGEEIKWGADHLMQMAHDTSGDAHNQIPDLIAALAGTARLFPREAKYADAARELLAAPRKEMLPPFVEFCATLDLYAATHDASLLEKVKPLYPGAEIKVPESAVRYESHVDEMAMVSLELGKRLSERADALLKQAANPFGVCAYLNNGKINFFGGGERGADFVRPGNSRFILEAARNVAAAYRYNSKIEYQQFIFDQFNWLLGNNPFGVSFVEGIGMKNLPAYALPHAKFPRGVPTGAVADGVMGEGNGLDRPWVDLGDSPTPSYLTNACPLWNSVAFLDALANLKRIRMSGAQKAQQ